MKLIKLVAQARISTSKGSFSAGDVLKIEEQYAKRLLEQGYAKFYEAKDERNIQIKPEVELGKLKVDELRELAEAIGFDGKDLKKAELIQKIIEEVQKSEAFAAILQMSADEILEQLGE